MISHYDVIVVGGGASGMTAAISAAENRERVLVVEQGDAVGRKLLASGNGRCNLLNRTTPKYYGDVHFASDVLRRCPFPDIISFLNRYGLVITDEPDGRMYPVTYRSDSVLSSLKNAIKINGVDCLLRTRVLRIERMDGRFIVSTDHEGEVYTGKRVIVCSGGAAQPRLGGSRDGYALLAGFGHTVAEPFPSLVPVVTDRKSISGLSGIRVRCEVSLFDRETLLHREEGELLFTDYGISGICVMQCSRFLHAQETHFEIDFLKRVFPDGERVQTELVRRRFLFASFSPVSLLEGIVAQKLSYAILKQAGIPLRGEKAGDLTDDELARIANTARSYRIEAVDTKGYDFAQVTAGGVSCDEFDPQTMESLIIPGLYACGEVLNVDGDCGGFNLMFAFASGIIAGESGQQARRGGEDDEKRGQAPAGDPEHG